MGGVAVWDVVERAAQAPSGGADVWAVLKAPVDPSTFGSTPLERSDRAVRLQGFERTDGSSPILGIGVVDEVDLVAVGQRWDHNEILVGKLTGFHAGVGSREHSGRAGCSRP